MWSTSPSTSTTSTSSMTAMATAPVTAAVAAAAALARSAPTPSPSHQPVGVVDADVADLGPRAGIAGSIDLLETKPQQRPHARRQRSSRFNLQEPDPRARELEPLPLLIDTSATQRMNLALRKLEQVSILFDFSDPDLDVEGKQVKADTLRELIDFVTTYGSPFPTELYPAMITMFSTNLFRTIPPPAPSLYPPAAADVYDSDDDDAVLELAWPHLQMVYELFLRFIESPNFVPATGKGYVDQRFVWRVIELFDSDDPRERDLLKTTLHRIYGKLLPLRSYVRRSITHVFFHFLYETQKHHGIAELLEIMGSIINGFALPLKAEHKTFLVRVLVPLHKSRSLAAFHPQLAYCVVQFVEKDPSLSPSVVRGILRLWPKVCSSKQLMFLNELEEILDVMEPQEFSLVATPVFHLLGTCIASSNFQVAERSLYYWNNEYVVNLMADQVEQLIPLVFPALYQNEQVHWNKQLQPLVQHALRLLMEMSPNVFDACVSAYTDHIALDSQASATKDAHWSHLRAQALKTSSMLGVPPPAHLLADVEQSPNWHSATTSSLLPPCYPTTGLETMQIDDRYVDPSWSAGPSTGEIQS